jgi:8-oxo-dGTP pyrophosphatase MutT (NUDIX family)
MTSVFVLRQQKQPQPPQILLLRRSPSDSYPLKWEPPGGSVDPTDESTLSAAARELWEESSLKESHFHASLGMRAQKTEELTVSEKRPQNWGIEPQDEKAKDVEVEFAEGEKILVTTFNETGDIWGKVNFLATTSEGAQVVIDPEEHIEWGWFTEEDVRTGQAFYPSIFTLPDENEKKHGRALEFTSQAVWRSLLEAFSVGRELGIIV